METYTYKILEVDAMAHTMIVQYTPTDQSLSELNLNLPVPSSANNIDIHINMYAPQDTWSKLKNPSYELISLVGTESTIDPSDPSLYPTNELATIVANYDTMKNEEAEFLAGN